MNPPRDTNRWDDPDPWDIDQWDLLETDGPDDFDEIDDDGDAEDPHLEVIESLDEPSIELRSIWINRGIRIASFLLLIFFSATFALTPVISVVRAVVTRPDTPDYFDVLDGAGYPFRFDRQEIRYSIVIPQNYPIQELYRLEQPLNNAMKSWSDPMGGIFTFVPAPADGSDDLLIHFATDLSTAGLAGIRPGSRYRPEIFTRIDIEGPMPSPIMLETVLCHEIGHALGIWGHSDYEGDCMYPIVSRRTPSARDVLTLKKIYGTEGVGSVR